MSPKISVITINYNNKEGLERTLKSVSSQDYQDFEYIVIDGGSTDGSKELIEKFADKITYWVSEPDRGIYNALNKGILAANGEYVYFLNSGDIFIDFNSLKKSAHFVDIYDIIYFNIQLRGQDIDIIKEYPSDLDFYFFSQDTLPHQATFIKASAFKQTGLYDESMKIAADWKWFINGICFSNLSFKKIDDTFSIFFLDGISSHNTELLQIEREKFIDELPICFKNDVKNIEYLKSEIKQLKHIEYKYNHLKKYRIIRLLDRMGIIRIL